MFSFVLRIIPFAIGSLALFLAWFSWQVGSPPAWSVFGEREIVEVAASRVDLIRMGGGKFRHVPVVEVFWPKNSSRRARVRGLVASFSSGARAAAERAVRLHPKGARVPVRPIEGIVYANRTDAFNLLHASFLSFIAVLFLVPGLLLMLPGAGRLWRPRGLGPRPSERYR